MEHDEREIGWLIRTILKECEVTVEEFAAMYGVARTTVYEWMAGRGGAGSLPYHLIELLAAIKGVYPSDLFLELGIDVNSIPSLGEEINLNHPCLALFAQEAKDVVRFRLAVEAAIDARRVYCYEGNLERVYALFMEALEYAVEAGAFRLAIYIESHLCNICEMIGKLDEAEEWFHSGYEKALQLQHEAKKAQDQALLLLATQLVLKIKIHWYWADHWARGARMASIEEGLVLLQEVKRSHYYQKIPDVYDFLARCSVALGYMDEALDFINDAEVFLYALPRSEYARFALFLDAGGMLPNGKLDYRWQEDQMRSTKVDVSIAAERPEAAFEPYSAIRVHLLPSANFGIHHWFKLSWQNYLSHQMRLTETPYAIEVYSFDDYIRDLKRTGDVRVLAHNRYIQGEGLAAKGAFAAADFQFQYALRDAQRIQANDIFVKSVLAATLVAVQQRNKPLAQKYLTMVEGIMPRLDNPLLSRMYQNAQREIVQL